MYLSNVNSDNLQKCKSTSYLQSTLSQRQNQAITMTDLQWLSSKVNMLRVIYLESLQELLGTSWDMEERSLTKSPACRRRSSDVGGKGLEFPCVHTFLGKPSNCLSLRRLKQLGRPVYHSTGFLQSHNSLKKFLKMPRQSMSISWNIIELAKPQLSQKSSQNATPGGSFVHFLE